MDTILKLLYAVAITVLLVSCGGNSSPEKEVIADKPVSIFTKAASFSFDRAEHVISNFTFDKVECPNELMLCEEIMKLSGGQSMSFTASGDASDYEGNLEFTRKVAGVFVVGKNELKANLLFTVRTDKEGIIFFGGILTFNNAATFKSADDEVSMYVKGKQ